MSRRLPTSTASPSTTPARTGMERLDLEFANGERRQYERLHGRGHGAVVVVPMLDDDTVLLVREYAAGVHRYELGLVKGRIDAGETPVQAADRELQGRGRLRRALADRAARADPGADLHEPRRPTWCWRATCIRSACRATSPRNSKWCRGSSTRCTS